MCDDMLECVRGRRQNEGESRELRQSQTRLGQSKTCLEEEGRKIVKALKKLTLKFEGNQGKIATRGKWSQLLNKFYTRRGTRGTIFLLKIMDI